jgi:hypothetical protein
LLWGALNTVLSRHPRHLEFLIVRDVNTRHKTTTYSQESAFPRIYCLLNGRTLLAGEFYGKLFGPSMPETTRESGLFSLFSLKGRHEIQQYYFIFPNTEIARVLVCFLLRKSIDYIF